MARQPTLIAVDGRPLNRHHLRGIGRYIQHLIELSAGNDDIRWLVLGDEPEEPFHLSPQPNVLVRPFDFKGYRWHTWEQIAFPARARLAGARVLFMPATRAPIWQPVPTVVTVHDTIPWTSDGDDFAPGLYRDRILPGAYRRAATVICGSVSAASDLARMWPRLEPKLAVIPHGVDEHYFRVRRGEPLPEDLQRTGIRPPYLLYVGGHIPRKRPGWALKVWESLQNPDVQLVVCGVNAEAHEGIRSLAAGEMRERLLLLGFVPEADMPWLYANASAMLYPTLYEGFGFPAVEAQACGTPALFSPCGSLAELVGPAAYVLPQDDLVPWVATCRRFVVTPLTDREVEQSRAWARRFSWQRSAELHFEVMLRAATRQK